MYFKEIAYELDSSGSEYSLLGVHMHTVVSLRFLYARNFFCG
jgi:hypothetical protein